MRTGGLERERENMEGKGNEAAEGLTSFFWYVCGVAGKAPFCFFSPFPGAHKHNFHESRRRRDGKGS